MCPIHTALNTDQAWDHICIVPWLRCHAACISRHCSVLHFPPMQHSEIYNLQIQVPVFKELFLWGTTTQAQDSRLWVEHLSLVDMLHFLRKHLHKEPQRGMSNLRETVGWGQLSISGQLHRGLLSFSTLIFSDELPLLHCVETTTKDLLDNSLFNGD